MAPPPAEVQIQSLDGSWVLDKKLSNDIDPLLKLQGIGWLLRKAITSATVTLKFSHSIEQDSTITAPVERIDLEQTLTGGIRGSPEKRILNWKDAYSNDNIFGEVIARNQFVSGIKEEDGKFRPGFQVETNFAGSETARADIVAFLGQGVILDSKEADDLEKVFLHDFIRSLKGGWTAEQIWALEVSDGERVLTRKVVVSDGSSLAFARLIYRFVC